MGTIIKSTAIIYNDHSNTGNIELAAQAAEHCISGSGIDKNEIDMLINVGVYREQNIIEPSVACLLQHKMGLNLDPLEFSPVGRTTFSIDVFNGSCGFIHAAHIANSFLKNDTVKKILVVSGDTHPSKKQVPGFPYTHMGAAALLENTDCDDTGFSKFIFETPESDYIGREGFFNMYAHGSDGRNNVTIETDKNYSARLLTCSIDTIKSIFNNEADIKRTKLIASQPVKGFGKMIAKTLGMDEDSALDLYDKYGDPNSAALNLQFHIAKETGFFDGVEKIVFIAVNSELSVACGVYNL